MPTNDKIDLEFDKNHLWHPYTSTSAPLPCYPVVSARGCELELEDGTLLVDGMSSWWAAIHGYNVPSLNQAASQQLSEMSHVMFGGITHKPATELGKKLLSLLPAQLNKLFLADSGSVAVEVAMKMALQYWLGKGITGKTRFLSFNRGYHGDTLGAMSVCDPETGMHSLFEGILAKQLFATPPLNVTQGPYHSSQLNELQSKLVDHHHEIAAVIIEPLVQGAGGMRIYHAEALSDIRALCDEYGVLLIFDEIATGFGRTGSMFAFEQAPDNSAIPDIITLGKAMTGGYLTLAATICSDKVAKGVCASEAGVFMHGPTFMANPLACSIANASLDILISGEWRAQVESIERQLVDELECCRALDAVVDVRVKGAIGVVETKEPVNVAEIQAYFVEKGVWIRPFGTRVYIMPPFVISKEQLNLLTSSIYEALAAGIGLTA
ncbi:adenosylmethionine--8-amino-7-oxononanoate transaminase [Corallincola platygyrae]|uniref:Adenosylmethionine-8-amino-7-oxononanoate aminotransferase n=1 Tax=Corallincola platygyrae TaxID=1193278 RepID=A0ABW4XLQ6_9GAMM